MLALHFVKNRFLSKNCNGWGKALYYVLETAALNNSEMVQEHPEVFEPMRDQRNAEIAQELKNLGEKFENARGPERFEALIEFGTNFHVSGKIIHAVGGVCGAVKLNATALRTIEGAASMIEDEQIFQKVIQAAEKVEVVVQENVAKSFVAESIEAEVINQSKIITRSITEVLTDIQKCGSKISLSNIELCKEVKALVEKLAKEASVVIDQKFRDQFLSKWITENGIKKRVNMNIDHALNYEIKFKTNKKLGVMEIDFSGGHLAGSTENLAEKGLIKIIDKQQLPTGCWEFVFEDCFTGQKFTKTEFHASWNKEMIAQQSWDLFENPNVRECVGKDEKLVKYIKNGEHELSIVMKKHEIDINIVTSVPYKIEMKEV